MPEPIDKLRYACEDEAWELYSAAGPDLFLASIAVSLKRLADAVDPREGSPKGSVLWWLAELVDTAKAKRDDGR